MDLQWSHIRTFIHIASNGDKAYLDLAQMSLNLSAAGSFLEELSW